MKARHLFLCLIATIPLTVAAQEAHSLKWVNLRAGPARDYPVVARLGPGTPLAVQGCMDGYSWCDVIAPGDARGWVYAGNIAYPYQSADVPILTYGAMIGFPIVSFVIGDYWGQYYRNRPWYGNQAYRGHSRPGPQPGMRPPGSPRPFVRPPNAPQPPGMRPPGDQRPPPGHARPPGGAGGGGPGGGHPPNGVPNRPPSRPPNQPPGRPGGPGGPGQADEGRRSPHN